MANADWGKADTLARAEGLDASIDLLAFWRENRIKVERLIVTRPQLDLEIRRTGGGTGNSAARPKTRQRRASPRPASPSPASSWATIRVEGGLVTFDDRARMVSRRAEAIDLAINQPGADQPVKIDGGLTMAGQASHPGRQLSARPRDVAAGETSPLGIALDLPGGALGFDGTVGDVAAPAAKGGVEDQRCRDRASWLAWLGPELQLPDNALRSPALQAQLDLGAAGSALEDCKSRWTRSAAAAGWPLTLANPMAVEGEIGLGALDLDSLSSARGHSQPAYIGQTAGPVTPAEWSDEPIALPLPFRSIVDFRLRMDEREGAAARTRRRQREAAGGPATGHRHLDELQAYGGRLAGDAQATPATRRPMRSNCRPRASLARHVQALPARAVRRQGGCWAALAAAGEQRAPAGAALGGEGKIVLRDGAVLGINIAGMLRQIMTLGLNPGANQQQRTDFAEAGGSFKIKMGCCTTRTSSCVRRFCVWTAPVRGLAAAHGRLSDHAAAGDHARRTGCERQAGSCRRGSRSCCKGRSRRRRCGST